MADMETVIKGLEQFKADFKPFCGNRADWERFDAGLTLLKEQQQQIWELQDQIEYLTDKQKKQKFFVDENGKITPLPVVVRCKGCKWYDERISICTDCWMPREQTFFCADGKRRTDDA